MELVSGLLGALRAEDLDCPRIEAHNALTTALGGAFDALAADERGRTADGDLLALKVDIGPAQVEQLTTPRTRVGRDMEEGPEPMIASRIDRLREKSPIGVECKEANTVG